MQTLEQKIHKLLNPNNSSDSRDCGQIIIHINPLCHIDTDETELLYHVIFNPTRYENPKHPRFVETWDKTVEEAIDQLLKDCETIKWK